MIKKFIKTTKHKYGDGILSIAANFIQKGAFLIVALLLARLFGPKLFGEYAFLRQAFDVLIVFILFGGDKSLIYFSAINKSDGLVKLISVIKFVILIIILLFIISVFVRDQLLADYNFSYNVFFLIIFASSILLNVLIIFIEGYFIGIKSLKTYFKSVIISVLFYLPLAYIFGYKYGIMGVFVALFLHFTIQFFYIYLKEKNQFNKRDFNDIKNDLKQLYAFSFPIGIGEILVTFTAFLTSIALIQTANFEELGIYNVAMRMVMFIVFIPNLLNNILLSYLSTEINKERFLVKTVLLNLLLSGFIGFVFYIFSNQIFSLFGPDFEENGTEVFIYLIYGVLPFCSSLVLLQYLISIKKRWGYLFFRFLREGLTICFFVVFIRLDVVGDAILLSKCFVYANYISLTMLTIYIIMIYFFERKNSSI